MKRHYFAMLSIVIALSMVAIQSCKDMGDQPAGGTATLTANVSTVSLAPGGSSTVTLRGGNPPYRITTLPSAVLVSATLTNNSDKTGTLLIQAVSAAVSGRDSVVIRDTDPSSNTDAPLHEEQTITIYIQVNPAAVLLSTQVQPIFSNNCVTGCHTTTGGSAPFSLQSGQARANLVDVNMLNATCGGKRVLAGDANASGLIKKLEGTTCGQRMPLGGVALSSSDIALIRTWIQQGAQNN
jgi:hypothetical protein